MVKKNITLAGAGLSFVEFEKLQMILILPIVPEASVAGNARVTIQEF